MNYSLLDKTIQTYIWLGIVLYVILLLFWKDSFTYYNVLNIFTFATYAFLLWMSANKPDEYYTNKRLGWTVFLYSLFFVGNYMYMCDYYMGNTFLFSEADARQYEKLVNKLLYTPVETWISIITNFGWDYDDWGAPISMALIEKIIPSKLFLNLNFILMNTLNAIFLFNIGKSVMSRQYAYLASLTYAISSYSIFFMGCGLKEEILVFLVIFSIYMLYKYMEQRKWSYLVIGTISSILIVFFRPPITVFVWVTYIVMLLNGTKSNVIRSFFIIVILFVFALAFNMMHYSVERYAHGGDVTTSYMFVTTSLFQKMALYAGALIGPFPQLLQVGEAISYKPIFGAGLLFKFLFFFAFWKGFIYAIKAKQVEVYPLFVFCLLEMVGLSIALDGLELRKAMPHIPLFILAAFWFMDIYDEDVNEEVQLSSYNIWTNRQFVACTIFVFVATLVWNTLKII